jgi:ribosomal protein S12 methylthiotransferase accessory factor
MAALYQYSSSLRVQPIAETLKHARAIAPRVGIVRVTDTTRLDRVGMPVFASIRPQAMVRSLCVSAGKGLTVDEARIGAYMEAIELAFAEPLRAAVRVVKGRARDVLDGATRPDAIYDFCPTRGTTIAADAELPCIEAESIGSDARVLVPAEVVLFPLPGTVRSYFGSDGNGIASGNSVDEATVHGLTELIERDVTSFHNAKDDSLLIHHERLRTRVAASVSGRPLADALPPEIAQLVRRLDDDGFDLWLRYLPNPFGLPVIKAAVHERGHPDGIHFGYACALTRATALARAVCEALQCRLTVIHGGRDDLTHVFSERAQMPLPRKQELIARHAALATGEINGVVNFDEIPDCAAHAGSIEAALAFLVERLRENGLDRVLRAVLTPRNFPVHVVRAIVPRLELFAHGIYRLGPRLKPYLHAVSHGTDVPQHSPTETSR